MFSHDQFLFLHIPKTAGWTVRHILRATGLGPAISHQHHQHSALHELPGSVTRNDRFLFASIREPCAWYRSYVHYFYRDAYLKPNTEPLNLEAAIDSLLAPPVDLDHLHLPGPKIDVDLDLLRSRCIGFYSWLVLHQLNRARPTSQSHSVAVDAVIDTGQLREGLRLVLDELGIRDTGATHSVVDQNVTAAMQQKGHGVLTAESSVEEDISPELAARIYKADRFIVDLMGYTGPGSLAKSPLLRSDGTDPLGYVARCDDAPVATREGYEPRAISDEAKKPQADRSGSSSIIRVSKNSV